MIKKIKKLGKFLALTIASVIALSSISTAFAAPQSATGGSRGSQSFGIYWKKEVNVNYTDALGTKSNVYTTKNVITKVHFFARQNVTLDFRDYTQRAFCIEPEKTSELTSYGNTYYYNGNLNDAGLSAYNKRLTAGKRTLLNTVLANGYGNYRPASKKYCNYWYATQLLINEVITGMRNDNTFELKGSQSYNPTTYLGSESGAETTTADIQKAYDDIVGWVKLTLKVPDGTSATEAKAPTYSMSYKQSTNTYSYSYNFNDIIRSNLTNADAFACKLSEMNIKASDITVSNKSVSVSIDKANKKIVFSTSSPLTSPVTVSINNPRIRGINTSLNSTSQYGLMLVGNGSNQVFAVGASQLNPAKSYFKLTTDSTVILKLKKVSANPDLTEGNSCYSLGGAVYNIYASEEDAANDTNYVGSITTEEDGTGYYSNSYGRVIPAKDFWAKETTSSPGYCLDTKIHHFEPTGEYEDGVPVWAFTSYEPPESDPMYVFIKKVDAATGYGNADLAGAQFRVNYYDGFYNTEAELQGVQPLKSWVFKTDKDGYVEYSDDKAYFVSGDKIYENIQGYPSLPPGTVSIQEISAPTSGKYKINDTVYVRQVDRLAEVNSELEPVNPFVVGEVPDVSGLTIRKTSDDGVVKDLWFRVEGSNGFSQDVSTNSTGNIVMTGLDIYDSGSNLVKYTVTELGVKRANGTYAIPKRYTPDKLSQTVTLKADTNVLVKFHNNTPVGQINLKKTSEDGVVSNISFRITASNGFSQIVTTKAGGTAKITQLPVFNDHDSYINYIISEIGIKVGNEYKMPERYYKPSVQRVTFTNATTEQVNTATVTFNNVLKVGDLSIRKTSNDGKHSGIAFEVKSTSASYSYDEIFTTDSNGLITVTNLPIYDTRDQKIVYEVSEKGIYDEKTGKYVIPAYYFSPESKTVTLSESNITQTNFRNYLKTFNLKVIKDSSDDVISGVWFNIKSSDGSYDKDFATNSDGVVNISGLRGNDMYGNSINYTVKELGVKKDNGYVFPAKYKTVQDKVVEGINFLPTTAGEGADTATVDFFNDEKTANLRIVKKADDGKVDGLWFSVVDSNGVELEKKATNKNGIITYDELPVYDDNNKRISYTVTELGELQSNGTYKLPFRYNVVPKQSVLLNYNETTVVTHTVIFNNTLKKGSVTIKKVNPEGEPMEGIELSIYKSDDTFVNKGKTGSDGVLSFKDLDQGDYYMVETKTEEGYNLLKDKVSFTIKGDNNKTLNPTVDITNTFLFNIPNTGSNGILYLCIGGGVVLAAGLLIILFFMKKKKK